MEDNGKMRTSAEPNKIYIVGKVLMRDIQKCNFLNLSHCVKSYGHLCEIYQNHSPNMVMSRHPGFKFRKFLFLTNSVLNFGKVIKFGGSWLKIKRVTGKNKLGVENTPPPPPVLIGLSLNNDLIITLTSKNK